MEFNLSDEQKMIQETAKKFSDRELAPNAGEIDETEKFPREAWNKLSNLGFPGLPVPKKYGGLGLDYVTVVLVMEELARGCMATAGTYSVHLTTEYLVSAYGSIEQKKTLLPQMAEGNRIGALAITEPNAGSDAASILTRAKKHDDGSYIINGSKIFITTGGEADFYVVYVKTEPELKHKGISAFIIDKNQKGLSYGKKERKMGYGGSPTRELIFEDCIASSSSILGDENRGFNMVMRGMDRGRITVGAGAVGIAQAAFDAARAYALKREQFGRSIADFQGIQWKFADMIMGIEAARLLIYKAAYLASKSLPFTKESAMGKCYASDVAMRVTTEAVQILGGYGYTKDYPLERHMRDAKILQIVEGTNEIQRNIISKDIFERGEGL